MANLQITASMNIAIVDDDESARLCYQDILQLSGNFTLAGSFSNAAEALAEIPRLQPNLTLMDIRLPDLNGVECTRRLKRLVPKMKIIMVTGTHTHYWVNASLQAGATGYLVKPVVGDQLLATLQFVSDNQNQTQTSVPAAKITRGDLPLSPREKEVLAGFAEGLQYKEISCRLGISYSAVHKYQHSIFKKLRVANRIEAIRIWLDIQKS
jgi:DNA-binding NarL/FixJ family response regulator